MPLKSANLFFSSCYAIIGHRWLWPVSLKTTAVMSTWKDRGKEETGKSELQPPLQTPPQSQGTNLPAKMQSNQSIIDHRELLDGLSFKIKSGHLSDVG